MYSSRDRGEITVTVIAVEILIHTVPGITAVPCFYSRIYGIIETKAVP